MWGGGCVTHLLFQATWEEGKKKLAGWLAGWPADWLTDWFAGWLAAWLAGMAEPHSYVNNALIPDRSCCLCGALGHS